MIEDMAESIGMVASLVASASVVRKKATTVEASANIFGTSKIIRTEITYVTSRI